MQFCPTNKFTLCNVRLALVKRCRSWRRIVATIRPYLWPKWPQQSNWLKLRPVGNLIFLKVSYLAILFVPLIEDNSLLLSIAGTSKVDIVLIYLSSISLAVANLLYDLKCPVVIKRFESPNDLYLKMLEIKDLSEKHYPDDSFNASLEHCKRKFSSDKRADPDIGRISRLLFYLALLTYLLVFLKRTLEVIF